MNTTRGKLKNSWWEIFPTGSTLGIKVKMQIFDKLSLFLEKIIFYLKDYYIKNSHVQLISNLSSIFTYKS